MICLGNEMSRLCLSVYILIFLWQINSINRCLRSVLGFPNIFLLGQCPALSLANGVKGSYDRSPGGGLYPAYTRVSITCYSGFYGPSEVRCLATGSWGYLPPRCDQGNQKIKLCHFHVLL